MSSQFSISTLELVGITLKEIGKTVPVLGAIVGAGDSVFSTIELNRIKMLVSNLEEQIKQMNQPCILDERSGQVFLLGCEQARSDPLIDVKAKEYGAVVAHYMIHPADMDEVVEILDALRKLSAGDLRILYALKSGSQVYPHRRVDEIIGYSPYVDPFEKEKKLETQMKAALPSLKRLEGLGVLYLAAENWGGIDHKIGALSQYMSMYAHLTPVGINLVRALP